jgi:hypothetical protein
MRKYLHCVLAICLMGGVQACAPKACDEDAGYRAARLQLDRGNKLFPAIHLHVSGDELTRIQLAHGIKESDVKALQAAGGEYLKGIAALGKTYRLNEEGVIDDTGQGLLAAEYDDREGLPIWAAKGRQGILMSRLHAYRDGHNCSGD